MELNWKGYVQWAHISKKSILSICGAEDRPLMAIYTLLKAALDFALHVIDGYLTRIKIFQSSLMNMETGKPSDRCSNTGEWSRSAFN